MKKINLSKKQKISIAIALVVLCGGGAIGYSTVMKNMENKKMVETPNVELYYVPDAEKIFINGKLVPTKSKDLYITAEQGELNEIKVKDGDVVKKDTLLYTCKNTQIINEVEELKAQLEVKRKELKNTEDELMINSINIEISSLQDKIYKLNKKTYSYIYAPFAGKVYLNNSSNDGNQSGPVMTLQSTEFYIEGKVNEYDLFKINLEQQVEVMLYATKEKIPGNITFIGDRPYGSADNTNDISDTLTEYGVKIEVEQQKNFRNGLHVQGIAKYEESNLRIPISSIKEEEGKYYVFEVKSDIAHKKEVNVVEKNDEFVVINKGVKQGDILIRNLNIVNIEDGQNIYNNSGNTMSQGGIIVE